MRVAIRVDADASVGYGHAMRCLALCGALHRAGVTVDVASTRLPPGLADRFGALGSSMLPSWTSADLVVVDGYHLADDMSAIVAAGRLLAVVDDNLELPVELADVVVNQNGHAGSVGYERVVKPGAQLLLGSDYVMMRDDIRALAERGRTPEAGTCLVSFGGADPLALTLPVTELLARAPSVRTVVVAVSDVHPQVSRVEQLAAAVPDRVRRATADLIADLAVAEIAVIGGGTTMYETAHLGIPAVAAITAPNQRAGTGAAARSGFVSAVFDPDPDALAGEATRLLTDGEARRRMTAAGVESIDGAGADRVAAVLVAVAGAGG